MREGALRGGGGGFDGSASTHRQLPPLRCVTAHRTPGCLCRCKSTPRNKVRPARLPAQPVARAHAPNAASHLYNEACRLARHGPTDAEPHRGAQLRHGRGLQPAVVVPAAAEAHAVGEADLSGALAAVGLPVAYVWGKMCVMGRLGRYGVGGRVAGSRSAVHTGIPPSPIPSAPSPCRTGQQRGQRVAWMRAHVCRCARVPYVCALCTAQRTLTRALILHLRTRRRWRRRTCPCRAAARAATRRRTCPRTRTHSGRCRGACRSALINPARPRGVRAWTLSGCRTHGDLHVSDGMGKCVAWRCL